MADDEVRIGQLLPKAQGKRTDQLPNRDQEVLNDRQKSDFRQMAENEDVVEDVIAESTFEQTDLGNAKRLVARHGADLRHVAEWGKWITWPGNVWKLDKTGHADRFAKDVAEAILDEARQNADKAAFQHGLRAQSKAAITNMLHLAATEPGVPVTVDQLDADPMLFNTADGTIDLRTGQSRTPRREDLITKQAPVAYDPAATCPTWNDFLERVLPDPEARGFVQRLVGYALTGLTLEHVLAMFIGVGANGKSTLTNTLLEMMGDYATPAPPRLLMLEKHSEHPTQVADLLGKRLVVTQEVQQGHRLDEEMVKMLTGGDRLKARRMREDYWSFTPTHTLIMAANHKPRIAGRDHAIWRRVKVVPFDVVIPDDEQDKDLPAKLRAELPGILNWAIEGCLAWQKTGLDAPEAVLVATEKYRTESDLVAMFIEETCITGPATWIKSSTLYDTYKTWCDDNGLDHPLSNKALTARLEERGLDSTVDTHTKARVWRGIGLRAEPQKTL